MNASITHAIGALQAGHDPYRLGRCQHHDEPKGDAALIELGARWEKANADYRSACEQFSVAEEAAVYPDPPKALFVQDSDESFGFARFAFTRGDGRRWYYFGVTGDQAEPAL